MTTPRALRPKNRHELHTKLAGYDRRRYSVASTELASVGFIPMGAQGGDPHGQHEDTEPCGFSLSE